MQQLREGCIMATAVRVSEELVADARKFSRIDHRSVAGQIDHWARMGKCAEENPDLTYSLIKEILIGLEELEQGEKRNTNSDRRLWPYTSQDLSLRR
jgi:hypothetical protein